MKENNSDRIFFNIFGLKITIRRNLMSKEKIKTLNSLFEIVSNTVRLPNVKSSKETLLELVNTEKSICRFGDGEFNLIYGENLSFQKCDENLRARLAKILYSTDENIMVAIPNVFCDLINFSKKSATFWRQYCVYNREKIYQILDFNKIYYDSLVSRPYIDNLNIEFAKEHFDCFKQIWNNKNIVFVEGEASRLGIGNDLFKNAKSIKRVLCPATDAFAKYDNILDFCKTLDKNCLIICALGPTATVLAYDLSKCGFRALDLGHLDIEYQWFLMRTKKKIPIKNKYVNEAKGGKKISEFNDIEYLNQIIMKIE